MVEMPVEIGVTIPPDDIVATEVVPLLQVPPEVPSASVVVLPKHRVLIPVMASMLHELPNM